MEDLLTLTVYRSGEEEPYKARLKEPQFHEIEWATGRQEKIGTVRAGDQLLNTLWEDGDEKIREDVELRTKASKAIWDLAPIGEADMEENDDGTKTLKVWRTAKDKRQGIEPSTATLKQEGFEEIAEATATQEDQGTVAAGQYLLDTLAIKEKSDKGIWEETRLLLTACLQCFRLCPLGTAEIEKESKGIGDSSSASSSENEQPSSGTIGSQEG